MIATLSDDATTASVTPAIRRATVPERRYSWRVAELDIDLTAHIDWARNLRGYTPATLRAREWVLNRLAICIDRPLRDAEVGHVLFWEQTVVSGLAPQSRRAYCGHVRAFYRWMVAGGRMAEDPAVMLTRPKIPKPLPHPISERDLARALATATPKLAALMLLMADAGLRCQEVAGLLWSDVEIADGQTWICVRRAKGGKDRIVPVGLTVQRALRRHGTKTRGPVFLGRDGRQICAHSVSQIVNGHLRRNGIPSTAHKLRARYATQAAAVLDTPLVAQLCGWESLETARHYVKPDRERMTKLVAALDSLANPRAVRVPGGATTTQGVAS